MSYVFARDTAAVSWRGGIVRTVAGEAWYSNEPFVREHPKLFDSKPPRVRGNPGDAVEQATSAPGEKRRVTRRSSRQSDEDSPHE